MNINSSEAQDTAPQEQEKTAGDAPMRYWGAEAEAWAAGFNRGRSSIASAPPAGAAPQEDIELRFPGPRKGQSIAGTMGDARPAPPIRFDAGAAPQDELIARLRLVMQDHALCTGDGCVRHGMCVRQDTCPQTQPIKDAISAVRRLEVEKARHVDSASRLAAILAERTRENISLRAELAGAAPALKDDIEQLRNRLSEWRAWAHFEWCADSGDPDEPDASIRASIERIALKAATSPPPGDEGRLQALVREVTSKFINAHTCGWCGYMPHTDSCAMNKLDALLTASSPGIRLTDAHPLAQKWRRQDEPNHEVRDAIQQCADELDVYTRRH